LITELKFTPCLLEKDLFVRVFIKKGQNENCGFRLHSRTHRNQTEKPAITSPGSATFKKIKNNASLHLLVRWPLGHGRRCEDGPEAPMGHTALCRVSRTAMAGQLAG
jgi:hypothetical protein